MKSNREDDFLNDLAVGDATDGFREASLRHGLAALKRERRRRQFTRVGTSLAVVLLAVALTWWKPVTPTLSPPAPLITATTPNKAESGKIRLINDEELLAMFKDRPVALVGSGQNRRLVFLEEQVSLSAASPAAPPVYVQ